jgi:hypothetical protein
MELVDGETVRSLLASGPIQVTAQAVGDFAGVNSIILLLGRCDRPQHQRMRHLHLLSVGRR